VTRHKSLSGVMYDACTSRLLLCINQHTKFEVPSFTNSKDMIGTKLKNGSRDTDHAPFSGGSSSLGIIYLCTKFDGSSFSQSRDMIGGRKILNASLT